MKIIEGGVTAAAGFQTASTAAGIKYKNREDMALIYSEAPCKAARYLYHQYCKSGSGKMGPAGSEEFSLCAGSRDQCRYR